MPSKAEKSKAKKKRDQAVKEVDEDDYYDEEVEEEGKQVIAQKVKRSEKEFTNEAKQMKRRAQQARAPSAMKMNEDEN